MTANSKKLSLAGTLAISVAAIAPTGAMAFNTPAVAKLAGINTPLSFIFGALAILLVGSCFAMMAHQTSQAGSVYAYNRMALGEKTGFITGWILMLVYICGGAGFAGVSANFIDVFLKTFGMHLPVNLLALGLIVLMWAVTSMGVKITSMVSLTVESIAILILVVLCAVVVAHGGQNGMTLKPVTHIQSVPGIGQGIIYVIICFAGFEESTTLTTRIHHPRRLVPLTILITIISIALFFVVVSYIEVVGFGLNGISKFANSTSPLNNLAVAYAGKGMTIAIDLATMISSIASFLGIMNACAYMFYALGNKRYLPKSLGHFSKRMAGPSNAINLTAVLYIVLYLLIGVPFGSQAIYSNLMDIAGIGFITVYILVCVGTIVYFKRHHDSTLFNHQIVPGLSVLILLFPLISSLMSGNHFPMNLYPFLILLWIVIGIIMAYKHKMNY